VGTVAHSGIGKRALDTPTTRPEEGFSLSSPKGGEGRGEEANLLECPSPRPSPRSFLAGRGRKFLVVISRCAPGKQELDFTVEIEWMI